MRARLVATWSSRWFKPGVVLVLAIVGAWVVQANDPSPVERLGWVAGFALAALLLAFVWASGNEAIRWTMAIGALLGAGAGAVGFGSESPLTPVGGLVVATIGAATLFSFTAWAVVRTGAPADLPEDYRDPEPAPAPRTPVPVAEWEMRAGGRFVDLALILAATQLLGAHVLYVGFFPYFFGLWFLWEVPLMAAQGRTPTKVLFRTRVVAEESGSSRLGLRTAARRWLLLMLNLPFAFMSTRITGDVLWALDPRLSLEKGLAAGTIEVSEAELSRLRSMPPPTRERLLAETARTIREIEPEMSRGLAIGATVFLAGCFGTGLILAFV
ncbi:MAG TPA: RDD family protein [Solirubrobacterales bacterium]